MTRFKAIVIAAIALSAAAQPEIRTDITLDAGLSSATFAPYYIASNRHGHITQGNNAQIRLKAEKEMDRSKRFSYAFGAEAQLGLSNATDYLRYNSVSEKWFSHGERPAAARLTQLFGAVKYGGVFAQAGMRDTESRLLDHRLSSGDLVRGNNAAAMPGASAGFIDFQPIPFTNGWVEIDGEIGYYKCLDNAWLKSHFSYYKYHLNLGGWYNYKRCFFRTKPSMPFSLTVGLQAAAQFAGTTTWYQNGHVTRVQHFGISARDLVDMLVIRQGDDYWKGNHVGAWDINMRYRLRSGHEIKLYAQWLWEDGSGIGKLNGWDGLWGAQWIAPKPGIVSSALVEVLTFMNQSGPMHYDPADIPGNTMPGKATGADNYYNNTWYNGYAYYGMSIGSPMFPSPIYNVDGYTTAFVDNRFWGVHTGVSGQPAKALGYRLLAGYRRFFGTPMIPRLAPVHDFSIMAEATWTPSFSRGLAFSLQVAGDSGNSVYGNNFGAMLSVSYSGIFNGKRFTPCAN